MTTILIGVLMLLWPSWSLAQWTNEPAGSQTLTDWNMTTPAPMNGNDIPYSNGWKVISGRTSAQSDSGDLVSPPGVAQIHFNGVPGGSSGGNHYFALSPERDDIFVGFEFALSSNFDMHAGNKLFFVAANNFSWDVIPALRGNGGGPYSFEIYFANTQNVNNCHLPNRGPSDCPGTIHLNAPPGTTVHRGVHYKVEYRVKRSTCSTCQNGIIQVYLNGLKVIEHFNVNMPNFKIGMLQMNPTYGGFTTAPDGIFIRYGHVHVSVPGSGGGGGNPDTTPPGQVTGVTVEQLS